MDQRTQWKNATARTWTLRLQLTCITSIYIPIKTIVGPEHGNTTSQDKYLPVDRSPSTFGSSVSVTDLRIVDRGVFGPTGGYVRYADVICNPPKLCWYVPAAFLQYCPDQRCQAAIFSIPASIILWLSHPCLGLRRLETFMAPYLSAVMARCWLARDGRGNPPPLLKPQVYYRELSPAGLGISRYIGAPCCISG